MKIRNVTINGIFLYDGNENVVYTIGDILIFNNVLWKCIRETDKSPNNDSEGWELLEPNITNAEDLIKGNDRAKYVTARVVRDALFGPKGVARFLTFTPADGDTYINTWGTELSGIDHSSTYVITTSSPRVTDMPPVAVFAPDKAIVNTHVAKDNQRTQEVITFYRNGSVASVSYRSYYGGSWTPWKVMHSELEPSLFKYEYELTKDRLRKMIEYTERNYEKYTLVWSGSSSEIDFRPDYKPEYNTMVQVEYVLVQNGSRVTARKWVTIFKSDIFDSDHLTIMFDEFPNSQVKLILENRKLKVSGSAKIVKVVKFIGNVSENSDGTDSYQFQFQDED